KNARHEATHVGPGTRAERVLVHPDEPAPIPPLAGKTAPLQADRGLVRHYAADAARQLRRRPARDRLQPLAYQRALRPAAGLRLEAVADAQRAPGLLAEAGKSPGLHDVARPAPGLPQARGLVRPDAGALPQARRGWASG